MVELINNYLCVSKKVFEEGLKKSDTIFYAYQKEKKKLLIAPGQATFFPTIHANSASTFLKIKNAREDRCFQIANLILDFDIDPTNRSLPYKINSTTQIVFVSL